ncbi:hypothetical protein KHC23_07820 [Ancylobacter dichloromethanicus]|uniref:Uncharacterized protein n=1 Tax=Ancylobacter dichloromethanicus TaxID=518825 RepID=A0A9W6JAV5_9HYPH|nr:hypothetical protein [Ancylobacter dichloromethanicus]MBS7553554.1 hypothetical protein [Ancylobacter dichloromethanicus]GLK72614.1 hypothetical protein GCM10017643_27300 [Ancylobacter dichloromethanicus]
MNDMPRPADTPARPKLRLDFTFNPINLGALFAMLVGAGYAYGQLTMRLGLVEMQSSQLTHQLTAQTQLMERWVRTDEQVMALQRDVEKLDGRVTRIERP